MRTLTILLIAAMPLLLTAATFVGPQEYRVRTIVIDAGHGGKDPGCHGDRSNEADVVMAIADELGRILEKEMPGVKVIFTRNSEEEFVELHERAAIANKASADLFISIHANASANHRIHGTESWVMGVSSSGQNLEVAKRENAVILKEDNLKNYDGFNPNSPTSHIYFANVQSAFQDQSLHLASKIQHQFKQRVLRESRGVKQAGFVVLHQTVMPSVLVETGFLTNREEEKYLNSELGQVYIASGIFRAIRDYRKQVEE